MNNQGFRIFATAGGSALGAQMVTSDSVYKLTVTGNGIQQWHHVVAAYDSLHLRFYVDGILKDSVSTSGALLTLINNSFVVGNRGDSNTNALNSRIIDDVALWNRALQPAEINALFTGLTCPARRELFLQDSLFLCTDAYTLDAGDGYESYEWSNGDNKRNITIYETGKYLCTVTNGICKTTDLIFISIFKTMLLPSDTLFCKGDSIRLDAKMIKKSLTNWGTRFWTGYGHHQSMEIASSGNGSQDMVLFFQTDSLPATINIFLFNSNGEEVLWKTYYMKPSETITSSTLPKYTSLDATLYGLPCGFLPPWEKAVCNGVGVFKRGIRIESNNPIAAYSYIYTDANSGITNLIPYSSWGKEYCTINSNQNYDFNCYSWIFVIAANDSTKVQIIPSTQTRVGNINLYPSVMTGDTNYYITLKKGEIYQLLAKDPNKNLSGTKIRSVLNTNGEIHPIAVFAGSSRTRNPQPCGSGGGDNDIQQCFPTETWGKRYLVAPMSAAGNNALMPSTFNFNSYKIIVKDSNTILKKNGIVIPRSSLINGNTYVIEGNIFNDLNQPQLFEADKPFMLGQFMTGGGCLGGSYGDPEMIYLTPMEQGINNTVFLRSNKTGINFNYLTLVVHKKGLPSLLIDSLSGNYNYFSAHPQDTNYVIVVKGWPAALKSSRVTCDSPFVGITYGLGSVESYGFNIGRALNDINGEYSALDYRWSTGDTTESIVVSPIQTTTYYLSADNGISSCKDSVTVFVKQPTASITKHFECSNYDWNGQTYTQSGTYSFLTTNAAGCDSLAELQFATNNSNPLTINIKTLPQTGNRRNGSATAEVSGGTPPYRYLWTNGARTQSIDSMPAGSYSLTVTDSNNCSKTEDIVISKVNDEAIINLYPNPTEAIVSVSISLTHPQKIALQLTDIKGRRLLQQNPVEYGRGTHVFPLNIAARGMNNGTYILTVNLDGIPTVRKIVLKK